VSEKDGRQLNEGKTEREQWKPTVRDIILYSFLGVLFIGQVVFCFISYNGAGWDFVLYIGWAIAVVAFFIVGGMARIAFVREGKSPNKESWLKTTVLVDTGIYAVVRHPMYLSFMMYPVALMLISQHWLSVIFGIPVIVYFYVCTWSEERSSIERFGDSYRKYVQKVPRMNLFLGILRLWRRNKQR